MTKKAFTLVEILLYFTILSIVLFALMSFSIQILYLNKKSENMHELKSNIDFITNKIITVIQGSESVNTGESIFDLDFSTLSLDQSTPAISPTNFYVQDGDVYIKEGANQAIKLNSDSITCQLFQFSRVAINKAPDQIILDLEFTPLNTEISNLNQTFPVHSAISLRKAL